MKKRLFIPAALFLALCLLTACGSSAPKRPEPALPPLPPRPGETTETVEAAAMRLERTEGAVTLTDEDGTELTILEKMRLQSGNALATAEESLAGISLDDAKAATVGERSRASIRQDGRKLELTLSQGALYFNVSRPLEEDESFDIRTATMTLGIRGTNGYVETVSETQSVVILTSGRAVITAPGGAERDIRAGERVSVETAEAGTWFTAETLTVADLPALLVDELRADPEALDRVLEEAGLDPEALENRLNGHPFSETTQDEQGYTVYEYDENGVPVRFVKYWEDGSERCHGTLDALGRPTQSEISRTGPTGPFRELCLFTYAPDSPHVSIVWSRWQSYDETSPILNVTRGLDYTMSSKENHVDVDAVTSIKESSDHIDVDRITIQEYAPDGTLLRETRQ